MIVVNEFCKACAEGDIAKIHYYLSLPTAQSTLEQSMHRTDSPLYLAAINNRSLVCEVLLQAQGSSDKSPIRKGIDTVHPITHKTALHAACELGFYDIVTALVSAGAKLLPTRQTKCAFHLASTNGHLNICKLLLLDGHDDDDIRDNIDTSEVDCSFLLMSACYRQDYAMAKLLLDYCDDDPSEHIASCHSYNALYRDTHNKKISYCPLSVACELQD